MNTICHNIKSRLLLFVPTIMLAAVSFTACGGDETAAEEVETVVDNSYRYDHIDKFVQQYSDIIMSTPPEGMEMERLLMDINSRCEMLMAKGDTLTALYFHHAIEHNVRNRDNALADRIFGACPYTAFTLGRE